MRQQKTTKPARRQWCQGFWDLMEGYEIKKWWLWVDLNHRPQHYESAGPKINFNKNSILEFKKYFVV